jgi:hypothetical protein
MLANVHEQKIFVDMHKFTHESHAMHEQIFPEWGQYIKQI